MNTKLTLRMDEMLVRHAKTEAAQRGKSVSQMFSEFVLSLGASKRAAVLPPVTESLLGIVKNHTLSEEDYREHLREKHS
jgi:predicted HicB family RNase H-like nuclease